MSASQASPGNRLLAALPAADYQRLQPHLEFVTLPLRQSIYEAGDPITTVYFPRSAMVSLVATLEDGSTMKAGLVGQEGMTGIAALLGGRLMTPIANSSQQLIDINGFTNDIIGSRC